MQDKNELNRRVRVTITLTPAAIAVLDDAQAKGDYASRSAAVEHVVRDWARKVAK